jgi:hypothetical protein
MARRAPVIGKTDRYRVSFITGRSFLDIPHGVCFGYSAWGDRFGYSAWGDRFWIFRMGRSFLDIPHGV